MASPTRDLAVRVSDLAGSARDASSSANPYGGIHAGQDEQDEINADAANDTVSMHTLSLIASTGDAFCQTTEQSRPGWARSVYGAIDGAPSGSESNCFRYAQLSADGSTLVTYNEDSIQRTFAVPSTTISPDNPATISPFCTTPSPLRICAFALYNGFDITNRATTLVLNSQFDLPIRLTDALDLSYTHATYKWQNLMTERYIAPTSLTFANDGVRFVAGATECIAIFDINKGDKPLHSFPTRAGSKARRLYGVHDIGLAGLVTSLAISGNDNILAAGTTGRQIGFFANAGNGEYISSFSLKPNDAEDEGMKGNGVSQINWSPCGRYLFIAERQSDALLVYDIRYSGRRLSYLAGRRAVTTQKLSFDVCPTSDGDYEIWGGGTDGKVRIWRGTTAQEGRIEADVAFQASSAAVSNTILCHYWSLLLTTSGQRREPSEMLFSSNDSSGSDDSSDSDDSSSEDESGEKDGMSSLNEAYGDPTFDNVLKVWKL